MCIAVTDEAGDLKVFLRMDGAAQAFDRYRPEQGLHGRVVFDADARLVRLHQGRSATADGITHTPRLTVFGSGFPIKLEGEIVGAIGLSGGH